MTNDDLNQIDKLLKKRLTESEGKVMAEVGKYMEDEVLPVLESHTKTLEAHTRTLESHTTALKQIVSNTEHNSDNTVKLDKRVTKLENQAGIVPPPNLTIAR